MKTPFERPIGRLDVRVRLVLTGRFDGSRDRPLGVGVDAGSDATAQRRPERPGLAFGGHRDRPAGDVGEHPRPLVALCTPSCEAYRSEGRCEVRERIGLCDRDPLVYRSGHVRVGVVEPKPEEAARAGRVVRQSVEKRVEDDALGAGSNVADRLLVHDVWVHAALGRFPVPVGAVVRGEPLDTGCAGSESLVSDPAVEIAPWEATGPVRGRIEHRDALAPGAEDREAVAGRGETGPERTRRDVVQSRGDRRPFGEPGPRCGPARHCATGVGALTHWREGLEAS